MAAFVGKSRTKNSCCRFVFFVEAYVHPRLDRGQIESPIAEFVSNVVAQLLPRPPRFGRGADIPERNQPNI